LDRFRCNTLDGQDKLGIMLMENKELMIIGINLQIEYYFNMKLHVINNIYITI